jgi:hypothetical protein
MYSSANVRSEIVARETRRRGWQRAATIALVGALTMIPSMGSGMAAQEPVDDLVADAVPSPCDFATGGGFVVLDGSKKANFGAHGGCKNGDFWGHVNYVDHAVGLHVSSLEVTGYVQPFGAASNVRDVCGIARTNLDEDPVYFRVRLIDNGEPGTLDQFGIRLSNGYHVSPRYLSAGGKGGGDVQLHLPNPSTIPPLVEPTLAEMCHGVAAPGGSGGGGDIVD